LLLKTLLLAAFFPLPESDPSPGSDSRVGDLLLRRAALSPCCSEAASVSICWDVAGAFLVTSILFTP
jgi:hypothetical protein